MPAGADKTAFLYSACSALLLAFTIAAAWSVRAARAWSTRQARRLAYSRLATSVLDMLANLIGWIAFVAPGACYTGLKLGVFCYFLARASNYLFL